MRQFCVLPRQQRRNRVQHKYVHVNVKVIIIDGNVNVIIISIIISIIKTIIIISIVIIVITIIIIIIFTEAVNSCSICTRCGICQGLGFRFFWGVLGSFLVYWHMVKKNVDLRSRLLYSLRSFFLYSHLQRLWNII